MVNTPFVTDYNDQMRHMQKWNWAWSLKKGLKSPQLWYVRDFKTKQHTIIAITVAEPTVNYSLEGHFIAELR